MGTSRSPPSISTTPPARASRFPETPVLSASTAARIDATNDPAGNAVDINGSNGNITIAASIAKTTAGDIVEITGRTGGTVTFTGDINASGGRQRHRHRRQHRRHHQFQQSDQPLRPANTAVDLTNNTNATVNFNSTGNGLDIATTSGFGFNATGGGTVTVTGSGNTITSGTGTALNVANTTIDVTGLTFQSISSSGGSATGIILDNAGSGGFTVTGGTLASKTGTNGQTTTGIGIYLNNTDNISLSNMNFTGVFQNFGIRGEDVNNFTLKDLNLTGTFGDNSAIGIDEGTIRFGTQAASTNGLTGTALFNGNAIQGGAKDNVAIFNGSAGGLNVTFQDSAAHQAVIGNNQAGGNIGIDIQTGGAGSAAQGSGFGLTATVIGVQFTGSRADMIFVEALQKTTQNLTIINNIFANGQADKVGGGVNVNSSAAADTNYAVTYNISNNTFTGAVTSPSSPITKGRTAPSTASFRAIRSVRRMMP